MPRDSATWLLTDQVKVAGSAVIIGSRLVLTLDTLAKGTPDRWLSVDSASAQVLPNETIAISCGRTPTPVGNDTVALVPDVAPSYYGPPRLAWILDAATRRIRSAAPDSIQCARDFPRE